MIAFSVSLSRRSRSVPAVAAALAFLELLVLRHGIVLHDLALEDPHLDAACAIGGERGAKP
jgi:hypothetical protein